MHVSENVEILLKLVKNRTGETSSFAYIVNVLFPPWFFVLDFSQIKSSNILQKNSNKQQQMLFWIFFFFFLIER